MTTVPPLPPPAAFALAACRVVAALAALATCGCRSLPPQPPIDFSGPGWILREGQAVWRPRAGADGIAGDLLVATHPDGRSVVQFTKTPLPFIVAQRTARGWQAQIIPRNKTYSGRGAPPARLLWLHLPEALVRGNALEGFRCTTNATGGWRFERCATGESLEGYFEPPPRPRTRVVEAGENLARLFDTSHETFTARSRRREEADGPTMGTSPPPHVGGYVGDGISVNLPPQAPTP